MRLVLIGPPGAGKGTQAKVLSAKHNIPHVSTGDILRAKINDESSEIGKKAREYVENGKLVPDEVVVQMVEERIAEPDAAKGFILDGFPRNERQAVVLDEVLSDLNIGLDIVLYFKTSTKTIINRLSGRRSCPNCGAVYHVTNIPPKVEGKCDLCGADLIQRKDDKEDTIRKRIEVYEAETKPLLNYYSQKGLLREVSGDLNVDELSQVLEQLFLSLNVK